MLKILFILFLIYISLCKILEKKSFYDNYIITTILSVFIFFYFVTLNKAFLIFLPLIYKKLVVTSLLLIFLLTKDYDVFKLTCFNIFNNKLPSPKNPTIFICNYPSQMIDYLVFGLFDCKISFILAKAIYDYIHYFFDKERLIYHKKGLYNHIESEIKDKIKKKYSIFVYTEREYYNRKNIYEMTQFRTGIFNIAKNNNISITPIVVDHGQTGKVHIFDPIFIKNVDQDIKNIHKMMSSKLKSFSIKI
jgi:hypothetical protein